jgi:S-DNA-T family DNA segregation ATPase FtsK/SpoIIIE
VRIAVTAVDAVTSHSADVLLELSPETTVAEIERALGEVLPNALGGTWLEEDELPPTATVEDVGLRAGCRLSLGGPLRTPRPPLARAELRVISGPESGAIYLLPDGESKAGTSAAITLPGPGVAPQQVALQSGPSGVTLTNLHNDQPARRGGTALSGTVSISPEDVIEVGRHLVTVVPVTEPVPALLQPGPELTLQLHRPAREGRAEQTSTVELPAPPGDLAPPRVDLRMIAIPVVPAVLLAVILSPAWLWLLVLAPALVAGLHYRQKQRSVEDWDRAEAEHEQERIATSAEIRRLAAAETLERRLADPDAAALLRSVTGHDTRLWERRPSDEDFLRLRVGTAKAAPRSWQVLAPEGVATPPASVLHDVPHTLDLRAAGTLALVGPPDLTQPLARWLMGQAAALHSPQDLSIWLLTDPLSASAERDWAWLRWLPHSARVTPAGGSDGSVLIGNTEAALAARLAELSELVAQRLATAEDPRSAPAVNPPDVLVVVDVGVTGRPEVADLLKDGPRVGVHLICLVQQEDQSPVRCGAEIWFEGSGRVTLRRGKLPELTGIRAELVRVAWAEKVARALAPVRLVGAGAGTPPLPVLVAAATHLGLPADDRSSWVPPGEVRLGVSADGPFTLDLEQDGPHAVVAGAPGSGRTQLLRTLVCGLAAAHRPDALGMVLIDGSSRGSFDDLAGLPHCAAVLSPADGADLHRVLSSVVASRTGSSRGPSSVVVVVDGVEELLEELPSTAAHVNELVQSGRGAHLVLGTQRPSTVMTARLRETAGIRIALRLESSAESLEVLESPAAATIARGTPGRAYARVRQGRLVGFQTALLDGVTTAEATSADGVVLDVLTWTTLGDRPTPGDGTDEAAHQVVDRFIAAMRATAEGSPAEAPWLPPLPETVALPELQQRPGAPAGLSGVVYGLADLPADLSQPVASWDVATGGHLLVAGDPRSGRSTFLTTLAASLTAKVTPSEVHLYGLDCGGGALLPLAQLPHCGAIVVHHEVDRADRLIGRLAVEVSRRRQQLADRGFADLAAQRSGSADPLPYLVLLLDGWEGFLEVLSPVEAGRLESALLDLVRDGAPAGLRLVVTGDAGVLTSELASLCPEQLLLRLEDREHYTAAGLDPRLLPDAIGAGRAFRRADRTAVQVARLSGESSARAQSTAIEELAASLPAARGRRPFRVDLLPDVITAAEASELGTAGVGAAFAVGGDELRLQTVNLAACGPGFTITGPAGSGKSTALVVLAQALLDQGTRLCLLTPKESPLGELADLPGVLSSDVPGLRRTVGGTIAPLAVLIDDAELLQDDELDELLQQVLDNGRRTDRSVVLAGATDQLADQTHGFAFSARRSRSGLLLLPDQRDGDLLGVRLPHAVKGPSGRGVLVRSGQALQVQVPLP